MSAFCDGRNVVKRPAWGRRCREVGAWVLPSAVLALMPKCPACVAAYIALATGIGISLPAATHLRLILVILCLASLAFLAARRVPWFMKVTTAKKRAAERQDGT